ncbi:hypothetical protein [Sinomonas sp. RB5]
MAPHDSTTHSALTVSHTTPLWRLLATVGLFGGLGMLAYGLRDMHLLAYSSTVVSCTILFAIGFWARRASTVKMKARFGPFHKIATALVESQADISAWVNRRTLLAGLLVAFLMGNGVALLRAGIETAMASFTSPWLAGGIGCLIGAAAVAPEFFRGLASSLSIKSTEKDDESDDLEPAEAGK